MRPCPAGRHWAPSAYPLRRTQVLPLARPPRSGSGFLAPRPPPLRRPRRAPRTARPGRSRPSRGPSLRPAARSPRPLPARAAPPRPLPRLLPARLPPRSAPARPEGGSAPSSPGLWAAPSPSPRGGWAPRKGGGKGPSPGLPRPHLLESGWAGSGAGVVRGGGERGPSPRDPCFQPSLPRPSLPVLIPSWVFFLHLTNVCRSSVCQACCRPWDLAVSKQMWTQWSSRACRQWNTGNVYRGKWGEGRQGRKAERERGGGFPGKVPSEQRQGARSGPSEMRGHGSHSKLGTARLRPWGAVTSGFWGGVNRRS